MATPGAAAAQVLTPGAAAAQALIRRRRLEAIQAKPRGSVGQAAEALTPGAAAAGVGRQVLRRELQAMANDSAEEERRVEDLFGPSESEDESPAEWTPGEAAVVELLRRREVEAAELERRRREANAAAELLRRREVEAAEQERRLVEANAALASAVRASALASLGRSRSPTLRRSRSTIDA